MTERHERGAEHTVKGKEPTLPGTAPAPEPINPETGQHGDHWVLSEKERAGGFVRPVRRSYTHEKCGTSTSMPLPIAETYAKVPGYYGKTFCCHCRDYFPVGAAGEFVWDDGTGAKVGT